MTIEDQMREDKIEQRNSAQARQAASRLVGMAKQLIGWVLDIENLARIIYDPDSNWLWQEAYEDLQRRLWARATPKIDPRTKQQEFEMVEVLGEDNKPVIHEGKPLTKKEYLWQIPMFTTYDVVEVIEPRLSEFPKIFGKTPGALLDDIIHKQDKKTRMVVAGLLMGAKAGLIWEADTKRDMAYFREQYLLQLLYDIDSMEAYQMLSTHPNVLKFLTEYAWGKLGIKPMTEEEKAKFEIDLKERIRWHNKKQAEIEAKVKEQVQQPKQEPVQMQVVSESSKPPEIE